MGGACSMYESEEKFIQGLLRRPEKRAPRLIRGWEIILK
jgi:hypothetical protein